jgi:hypothetical protein
MAVEPSPHSPTPQPLPYPQNYLLMMTSVTLAYNGSVLTLAPGDLVSDPSVKGAVLAYAKSLGEQGLPSDAAISVAYYPDREPAKDELWRVASAMHANGASYESIELALKDRYISENIGGGAVPA